MNEVYIEGFESIPQFISKLADGMKLGNYYISHTESSLTFQNKYFQTTLNFHSAFHVEEALSLYIYNDKPQNLPVFDDVIQNLVIMTDSDEIGQYDTDEFMFDYCKSFDELAELIAQVPFENHVQLQKQIVQDADDLANNSSNIDDMIEKINDAEIKKQVKLLQKYFQNELMNKQKDQVETEIIKTDIQEKADYDEDLSQFQNAFRIIENMKQLLEGANEEDRKIAAAVVAILLEQGLS